MENSYGIGVRNRYALFLDDESDPLELLKEKEQEKEQKKKIKVAEKENKGKPEPPLKPKQAPLQKKVIKDVSVHNKIQEAKQEDAKTVNQRTNDGKTEGNFSKFINENREERNNKRNREDRQLNGSFDGTRDREDRPRRDHLTGGENFENRSMRSGRNNSGNNREGGNRTGGPKGRNFDSNRRGKREFDRQSGSDKTGVKPVEKRDGGGAHNWGSHKDIIEEVDKCNEIDLAWGEVDKNEAVPSASEVKESVAEPELEPSPSEVEELRELTLDEWKAQRAGRIKPQYNIRKAGEGEDPSQWKKMYELKKKEGGEGVNDSEDEEFDVSEYPQRVGRQKHVLDIDIHFSDARRVNAGIAGRGRGARSGRGGRPRGDRQQRFRLNDEQAISNIQEDPVHRSEKAPKVDDERDFPSLG